MVFRENHLTSFYKKKVQITSNSNLPSKIYFLEDVGIPSCRIEDSNVLSCNA